MIAHGLQRRLKGGEKKRRFAARMKLTQRKENDTAATLGESVLT